MLSRPGARVATADQAITDPRPTLHHDVAAAVARLLAGVGVGRPRGHPSGLIVVPLEDAGGHPQHLLRRGAGPLEVEETAPPRAGELLVANRRPGEIALHQGDLFTGGLADRAALTAMVVGPGEERVLPVEPVEPRWWWTGPPVLDGALDPPLSALLALAGLDDAAGGGLSAVARSCLWEVAPRGAAGEQGDRWHDSVAGAARGWLVLAGTGVLATRVWDRPRPLSPGQRDLAVSSAAADAARRFLGSLVRASWRSAGSGAGIAEVSGHRAGATIHDGRIVELGSVRLSDEIALALLRRPILDRGRTGSPPVDDHRDPPAPGYRPA